jgi:hypothetical protein
MDLQVVSLIVTILLALFGYLITHLLQLQQTKRKEQLELINKRLDEFYGPLFIASQASGIALGSFFDNATLQSSVRDKNATVRDQDSEWRTWVKNVFMPLNEICEKVIIEKAYLIRETETPACLLQLVAHVSAYKALLKKWEQGDYSEKFALISFPDDLNEYASTSYKELKAEQSRLIGILRL